MEITVSAGVSATVVKPNGMVVSHTIRKALTLAPASLKKSDDKAMVAFDIDGFTVTVHKNALRIPRDIVDTIHHALKLVSGVCDGAHALDNQGFNGTDARYGKILANAASLSPRMALDGARMLVKYKRQLPEEVYSVIQAVAVK
jgi:hypothetical protein